MKSFASDNYSGVHPDVMRALIEANDGHHSAYGNDVYTLRANQLFEELLGDVAVLYTFNGTGANVAALKCCTRSFQSVICSCYAHILVDECGAPVQQTGCQLLPVPTDDGKIHPDQILPLLNQRGVVHHSQPALISISQTTELGTVYTLGELRSLCDFAHEHGMLVHVDGARIANAVASLGCSLKEATVDCGVDIMSFGGTKNGLMMGEALLIFNDKLASDAVYFHKQAGQLCSKNRYIAAQFCALLQDGLWLSMASHANRMALLLADTLRKIPQVAITQSVDANAVFVVIPPEVADCMRVSFPFYVWDQVRSEQRLMCSFDTTEDDVVRFGALLEQQLCLSL